MKLKKLLEKVEVLGGNYNKNLNILNIEINSKKQSECSLFVCLKGESVDGHNFKDEAQQNGAVCFVVEEFDKTFNAPQIVVKNARLALSLICANFYKIKKSLKIIGITGTNGKTTTSYIIKRILEAANKKVGIIGTEGIYFGNQKLNFNMTTPDPIELYKTLKDMGKNGMDYVVMEVSAHAIYYNKVDGINFSAKALTNITEDHLDFFKTMEIYASTKMDFMKNGSCVKLANLDDDYGLNLCLANKDIYAFGKEENADFFAYDNSDDFSDFAMSLMGKEIFVNTKLKGEYNMQNAVLAGGICYLMGIKPKHIKQGLEVFSGVAGRLNVYKKDGKIAVIDFAHTPDGIEKVLKVIKSFTQGKVICLFGCGGNRDRNKRSIMGKLASENADYVYIANDNPRYEDEYEIANDIMAGIKKTNFEIILNRKMAIEKAVKSMQDGDTLALLGKGNETYIEINGIKHSYSEKDEIEKWGFKWLLT